MKISRDVIDQSVLTAVATVGFFNVFSPNFAEVRANQTAEDLIRLRESYRPAVGLALALGVGLSLVAKSVLPFLSAGATATGMMGIYEHALPPDRRLLAGRRSAQLEDPNVIDGDWREV